MAPPACDICSYRQPEPLTPVPVYHRHFSAVEVRITQGVEWSKSNRCYMCPTCEVYHPARPDPGLNVCLGASQLHEFHVPREPDVTCPPDFLHVDWNTIPGATIPVLTHAYQVDYRKYTRPMRVLLVAGINDLLKGGDFTSITNSILHLKQVFDAQNQYHPSQQNEFMVATILNPPKLCWFPDTGAPPPGHQNRLQEISDINNWIVEFNDSYGNLTPRFHRFGVKSGRKFVDGVPAPLHKHQLHKWRQSEPVHDMIHLNDRMRIRLGAAVIHHFENEQYMKGVLGAIN